MPGWIALLAFVALCSSWQSAHAAAYAFPGNLPPGCSAKSNANVNANANATGYVCTALTLAASDSIRIDVPTSVKVTGDMQASSAAINTAGPASALTLSIGGSLSVASGANLIANVSAASVTGAAGGAHFGGSISSGSGAITITEFSLVDGDISSASGAITVGHNSQLGGKLSSTSGAITVGYGSSVAGTITSTTGAIAVGYQSQVSGAISSTTGAISVGYQSTLGAGVTSDSGPIALAYNTSTAACVRSTGAAAIALAGGVVANSVCCGGSSCSSACVANSSTFAMPPLCNASPVGPHHVEIRHPTGVGLTCSPATLTVLACADAACATPYTGGVSGTLSASGSSASTSANWPNGASFSIPSGASSTSVALQLTALASVTLGASGLTPAASAATSCNFGTPACSFSAADAGFVFNVPNHVAETLQSVSVSAVRKADNAALCVPAFASVSKQIGFACAYQNPASGTLAVRVRGVALNAANAPGSACDAAGHAVTLDFNASGVASVALQYADVGQMLLSARYTGSAAGSDAGLVMTGSTRFIAAPASLAFSAISAAPLAAGAAFAATVTARNSAAATTPNFGAESSPQAVTLTFARVAPSGAGAADGVFSGSLGAFSAGAATATNLVWSEVGSGDLSASLAGANYLGTGLGASGTTANAGSGSTSAGAVGRFTPHHFDVVVTPACGVFSYAAQPFAVQVTAMNGLANPTPTLNYDGSAATTPNFAQAVTLSAAPALGVGVGSFSGSALAAKLFGAGVALAQAPTYTFSSKLTPAQTLTVRAIDADAVSSATHAEGATALRSGRLRLSNAFGAAGAALALPVQAQYWSGSAWVANSADSCSVLPAGSVALSNYLDFRGLANSAWSTSASAVTLRGGTGTLTLAAPSPGGSTSTGSVDLALNLGGTGTDQSCLGLHPASTGAALIWLRSQFGACAVAGSDPAARATFGVFSAESRKTADSREVQ